MCGLERLPFNKKSFTWFFFLLNIFNYKIEDDDTFHQQLLIINGLSIDIYIMNMYILLVNGFTWTSKMSSEQVNQNSVPEASIANNLIKDQASVEATQA